MRFIEDLADGFEKDHGLRSTFVRHLIFQQSAEEGYEYSCDSIVPKKLVRFWDNSDAIPHDVRECLDSWESLRGDGFELATFDDGSAARFIKRYFDTKYLDAFVRCWHPAMRSDYFRLCYILRFGGFYVDADDALTEGKWHPLFGDNRLKLRPLCYDLASHSMVPEDEIWENDIPFKNRIFYVNNNPLISPPDHPIIRLALEQATLTLHHTEDLQDIQSITGPGNLTAALVKHAHQLALLGKGNDFSLMRNWSEVAKTQWDLGYRSDVRNWRNVHLRRPEVLTNDTLRQQ